MNVVESASVAIAAAAASASAVSAYVNRQAVDRGSRSFVWPAVSHRLDPDGRHVLLVRLHNDGAGAAYDVRWSVGLAVVDGDPVNVDRYARDNASQVIRAMRPGEVLPPPDDGWLEQATVLPEDDAWWLLVRWTDVGRVRWELSEQGPTLLRLEPRRLRSWTWQVWRPKRDW